MKSEERRAMVVLVTAGDAATADRLAAALVEEGLAACVSVAPVGSVYRWQGELVREAETLLVVKSAADLFERLSARIRELHDYDVPEIVGIEAAHVEERYLEWLLDCCVRPGGWA